MDKEAIPILYVEDNRTDVEILQRALLKAHIPNPIHIASDGQEALDYLHRPRHMLGVLILDIHLPKIDGIQVLKAAKRLDPDAVAVMLTSRPSLGTAIQSLRREGAFDYLEKSKDDLPGLVETVRMALEKRAIQLQTHFSIQSGSDERVVDMTKIQEAFRISKRETDVLKCLFRGDANKEIAAQLFISELTVKGHLKHLYHKMKVQNRTMLISKVLSRCLLPTNGGVVS